MIKLLNILNKILSKLIDYNNKLLNLFKNDYKLNITSISYNESGRFLVFTLQNNNLYEHNEAIKSIYNTLMNNKKFISFGQKKVIITSALIDGSEFSYHHNVLLSNNTTYLKYYNSVIDSVNKYFDEGYPVDVIPAFKIRVWNMDNLANRNIKITRNTISNNNNKMDILTKRNIHTKNNDNFTPLIPLDLNIDKKETISISTMDIETMNYKGLQIPVAISIAYTFNEKKLFLIDSKLLKTDLDEAINKLWEDYFIFVKNNIKYFKNIFVHNLGSFDGYFIYKGLTKLFPAFISTIIDNNNKFIQISFKYYKFKINWKDSYRIYPISLDDLCKTFNVEGKMNKYDIRFNDLDLFNNLNLLKKFKEYSIQDSVCLLNALLNAQDLYFKDHNFDPFSISILSTSTLSLKILRSKYLKVNIPILKGWTDSFIRKGYYAGATDYYKAYGKNIRYYDVNSLYPNAMKRSMPYELINHYNDMSNIKLEDFFGFCLAEIETPKDTLRPLLPYKYQGKTIFPKGKWIGIYFSEELKTVIVIK